MLVLYHHRTQGRAVEAVHIHGLAGGLKRLGYEVEIIGPPGVCADPDAIGAGGGGRSRWSWVARRIPQVLFECLEIGYNAVAVPRLWGRCLQGRPRFIYERYALYNAGAVLAGAWSRTPVVLEVNDTVHMDRLRYGKSLVMVPLAAWFERRIFARAAVIVVVSGYLRDQLVARGVPAEQILVSPNAVDTNRFDPERVDETAVRKRHGLEGTVIGFAGCFAKWHGIDPLVRAFAALAAEFPETRLLMVGDGAERATGERLAADLGVGDRVVFTGRVPHSEMPEHVAAMDIGVMPASNEFGSPMKVFEYMAMGRAAVAPRYRPLEEAIEDGADGLLFDPADPSGLERCLRALLADPARRAALGAAARRRVVDRHQWVHNAAAVVDRLSPGGEARLAAATGAPVRET